MFTTRIPSITAIQRTTAVVAAIVALFLLGEGSRASSISCVVGASLMIANLFALSWTVRAMFAMARQAGGATGFGLLAAPFKMFLLAALTYLLISSGRVNVPGFLIGTLTQFVAIFIEVGRAAVSDPASVPVS